MKIVITGAGHLDGEHLLDLEGQPLDHYDAHIIKRIAGVRGGELEDAYAARDSDMVVALAVVTLLRTGKIRASEIDDATKLVFHVPLGGISVIGDPEPEGELLPPQSANAELDAPSVSETSSGATTEPTSVDSQVTIPGPTGSPLLVTGAVSDPTTSPV